jgi:ArsR family transcriptional regulator
MSNMKNAEFKCRFAQGILAGEDIILVSHALKAVAHPVRLQILCFIGDKEVSVKEIIVNIGRSQSNISQHLSVMKSKEIVDSKKVANRVFYHVKNPTILRMIGSNKVDNKA